MRNRNDFEDSRLSRNDSGGISMQGILGLIVIVGIVWGALSLFPAFNIPMDLENNAKKIADDYLRLLAREKTQAAVRKTVDDLRSLVSTTLEGHTWDPKDLVIEVQFRNVYVRLPYTLNINLFGFNLTFEKELDVHQQAISF